MVVLDASSSLATTANAVQLGSVIEIVVNGRKVRFLSLAGSVQSDKLERQLEDIGVMVALTGV